MAGKTVTVEALHGQLAVGQQESGPVVLLDRPVERGGRGLGFNGGHLMLLGLGACFKSVLLAAAEAREIEVRALRITITASEANNPFRYDAIDMKVELETEATPDAEAHLVELAERGCQVSNTLRAGATVRTALATA
jgi:uncharacterized OsmC-like protein